jgi:CAAX protease family protein
MAYLRTRPAWAQLLIFLGMAFGIFIILSFIGVMILSNMTGIKLLEIGDVSKWDLAKPGMINFMRGMLIIQFVGLFLVPTFLFAIFSDRRPAKYLGLRVVPAIYILLGVALLFVAIPLVELTGVFNHDFIPETTRIGKWMKKSEDDAARQLVFLLKRNTPRDLLLNVIFIAAFAGIGEELFFRGVLQRIFIKLFKSPLAGIIVTAIIFSAIHMQFYGFIPRFILGILLGFIYWYSGSLWPAIIAHFVYDAFFIVLVYFNPSLATQDSPAFTAGNQTVMALFSLVLVSGIIYLMKKKSTTRYADVYADDVVKETTPFTF